MIGCRPFTNDELARISAKFSGPFEHRNRLLFWLGIATGYRISELLSLRVSDLWRNNAPTNRVTVRRRHSKGGKQSQSARVAPLVKPLIRRWLFDYWERWEPNPKAPIFRSREGEAKAISRMQGYRMLIAVFTAADIEGGERELATHCMRKTYARVMQDHFGDIFKVQVALRHRSPTSTVSYLSFDDEELVDAIDEEWSNQPIIAGSEEPATGTILEFRSQK